MQAHIGYTAALAFLLGAAIGSAVTALYILTPHSPRDSGRDEVVARFRLAEAEGITDQLQ